MKTNLHGPPKKKFIILSDDVDYEVVNVPLEWILPDMKHFYYPKYANPSKLRRLVKNFCTQEENTSVKWEEYGIEKIFAETGTFAIKLIIFVLHIIKGNL